MTKKHKRARTDGAMLFTNKAGLQIKMPEAGRDLWETRDGRKVRIVAIENKLTYPIVGIIHNTQAGYVVESWKSDGSHPSGLTELFLTGQVRGS